MKKSERAKIYELCEKKGIQEIEGTIPAADMQTVRQGLARRGWKMTCKREGVSVTYKAVRL